MKLIPIITLTVLITVSCGIDLSILDTFRDKDKTLAAVLSYELKDNRLLHIKFDTQIALVEYCFNGEKIEAYGGGDELNLNLPRFIGYGEEAIVSITVKKDNGNFTRASLRIEGINKRIPRIMLNEISTDGTGSAPDRIELYTISDGITAGMVLSSSGEEVILPPIEVKQGDIIVVYWDKTAKEKDYSRQSGKTMFISGKANATLPSKNGSVILKATRKGPIVDAFIYSDSNGSGFSDKAAENAEEIRQSGHWSGDCADSSYITSSRVFARMPGAIDTDTADDWFITMPRRSTFGEENIYAPYAGDE